MVGVFGVEIGNGTAVGNHVAIESEFIAQDVAEQDIGTAAGLIAEPVVGTHYRLHIGFLYRGFKGRQVGII